MLTTKLAPFQLVKLVITAVASEGIPLDPEVEDFMRRCSIRPGDARPGSKTPKQELEEFKSSFFGFLNEAGIDSDSHEFLCEDGRFTIIMRVTPEDAEKIEQWYSQNS